MRYRECFVGCPYIWVLPRTGTPVKMKHLWKIRVNILYGSAATFGAIITHYHDVIMRAMAFQINSLTIVYSTVYLGADQRKTSKLRVTGLCEGNSPVAGEFLAPRARNAENVSISWRHHEIRHGENEASICNTAFNKITNDIILQGFNHYRIR